jgi:heme oxygenase
MRCLGVGFVGCANSDGTVVDDDEDDVQKVVRTPAEATSRNNYEQHIQLVQTVRHCLERASGTSTGCSQLRRNGFY